MGDDFQGNFKQQNDIIRFAFQKCITLASFWSVHLRSWDARAFLIFQAGNVESLS